MRLMTFALTTPQFYRREKTVTRRRGWRDVEVGELLCGVRKCRGLRAGESPIRLAVIRVTWVSREPLGRLLIRRNREEIAREGFPGMTGQDFVQMVCRANPGMTPQTAVTRIAFEYVPGGRYAVPGFCRVCGCWDLRACWSEECGACWWVDEKGRATLRETTLCSHCFKGLDCGVPDWKISQEMEAV